MPSKRPSPRPRSNVALSPSRLSVRASICPSPSRSASTRGLGAVADQIRIAGEKLALLAAEQEGQRAAAAIEQGEIGAAVAVDVGDADVDELTAGAQRLGRAQRPVRLSRMCDQSAFADDQYVGAAVTVDVGDHGARRSAHRGELLGGAERAVAVAA